MLFGLMQVVALVLVAFVMGPALAHALELPGKMRLDREDYLTVQTIYYPGFFRAGFAEPAALAAVLVLTLMTPAGTAAFWLALGAFAALVAMTAIFWTRTQPVNRAWAGNLPADRAAAQFFRTGMAAGDGDWTSLRDQWERSHLARAACAGIAFVLLAIATAL
jgi:hypothetical protein